MLITEKRLFGWKHEEHNAMKNWGLQVSTPYILVIVVAVMKKTFQIWADLLYDLLPIWPSVGH